MNKPTHEKIYLVSEDGIYCWSTTQAPGVQHESNDAVEYVRGDLFEALKADRDELKAQAETMREQLQIAHDCITCADETGYVQDVGFVDLEAVALELKLAIESTPQQCLREIEAKAGRAGFVLGHSLHADIMKAIYNGEWDAVARFANEYAATVQQGGAE